MKKLNLETFEIIVAITTTYEEYINDFLEEEYYQDQNEDLERANLVMDLYQLYEKENEDHQDTLEKIRDTKISINNVI